jgi:hypothetical protein
MRVGRSGNDAKNFSTASDDSAWAGAKDSQPQSTTSAINQNRKFFTALRLTHNQHINNLLSKEAFIP